MRFFNFFLIHMVQKYQNEIAPIFYYGKSPKTNEKDPKIPFLQPPDWGQPYWMTRYVMLVLEQCTWQDVTIYKSGQFSTCPVSCRGVKLKEKTWLNCSEKFSLTMHHEFSSSCSRIKILLQKNICIQQASLSGDDRGLKKGENLYLLKMCTRPNSGSYT